MSLLVPAKPATWNVVNTQTLANQDAAASKGTITAPVATDNVIARLADIKANLAQSNTTEVVTTTPSGIQLKITDARSTVSRES